MTQFLLIETQQGAMAEPQFHDARELARTGAAVTVFLASDGVSSAVRGVSPSLHELVAEGVRVWVDTFTLAQRALTAAPLEAGVVTADMDAVAELVTGDDTRVVWH